MWLKLYVQNWISFSSHSHLFFSLCEFGKKLVKIGIKLEKKDSQQRLQAALFWPE